MDVDGPGAAEEVVPPHLGDQLLAGEHPSRVLREELEQFELLVGQLKRPAPQPCRVGVLLDGQLAQGDQSGIGRTVEVRAAISRRRACTSAGPGD